MEIANTLITDGFKDYPANIKAASFKLLSNTFTETQNSPNIVPNETHLDLSNNYEPNYKNSTRAPVRVPVSVPSSDQKMPKIQNQKRKYSEGYIPSIAFYSPSTTSSHPNPAPATPLIPLTNLARVLSLQCHLYAKCEFLNPGGSILFRKALRTIQNFEKELELFLEKNPNQNNEETSTDKSSKKLNSISKLISSQSGQSPTLIFPSPSLGPAGALIASCKGYPSVSIGNSIGTEIHSNIFTSHGAFVTALSAASVQDSAAGAITNTSSVTATASKQKKDKIFLEFLNSKLNTNQAEEIQKIIPHSIIISDDTQKNIHHHTGQTSLISEILDFEFHSNACLNSKGKFEVKKGINMLVCSEICFAELFSGSGTGSAGSGEGSQTVTGTGTDTGTGAGTGAGEVHNLIRKQCDLLIVVGQRPESEFTQTYTKYFDSYRDRAQFSIPIINKYYQIKMEESYEMGKQLIIHEGLLCSPLAGAVLLGAVKAIDKFGLKTETDRNVVVVLDENLSWYSPVGLDFMCDDWLKLKGHLSLKVYIAELENANARRLDPHLTETTADTMSNWWTEQVVGDVPVKQPALLDPDMNIREAIQALRILENDQAIVQVQLNQQHHQHQHQHPSSSHVILGVTTLSHLECQLDTGHLQPSDTLGTHGATFRNFNIVKFDTKLGDLVKTVLRQRPICVIVQQIYECSQSQSQIRGRSGSGSGSGQLKEAEEQKLDPNPGNENQTQISIQIQNRKDIVLGLISEFDIMDYIATIEEHHLNKCPSWNYKS